MNQRVKTIIEKRINKEDQFRINWYDRLPKRFLNWFDGDCKTFTFDDFDIEKSHELCLKNKDILFTNQCYVNSMQVSALDKDLEIYVGWIFRFGLIPIHHCWTVKNNKIIDSTLGIKTINGYDQDGKLEMKVSENGNSCFDFKDKNFNEKFFQRLVGIKIPLRFMKLVFDGKMGKYNHVQNMYLFEYYLITVLKKDPKDVFVNMGYGNNGYKRWIKKFIKIVGESK